MSETHKPDEETVKAYASLKRIHIDKARAILENNYEEEAKLEPRAIALQCIKHLRQLSPKVQGMELRETETQYVLKKLESSVARLHNDFELHKEIAKQSVGTVNQILKEFDEYADKINKLEAKLFKPSLYERICLKLRYLRKR